MRVLLISTYELGRQPFGLASPVAWLREAGFEVAALDLSLQKLDPEAVRGADLVAFYLPMHTATRIAAHAIDRVRDINPEAHLCAYGLYAPVNRELLRRKGVQTLLGGEFEAGLVQLARRLAGESRAPSLDPGRAPSGDRPQEADAQPEPLVSLARQEFRVPQRSDLPPLEKYARLVAPGGRRRTVGYTEASRGCKHLCRHCPVVPVYGGVFRIVPTEVVLEDIRRQVEAGAEHITFGDPDFFNGPGHAARVVEALHREFPDLGYDVTIKIEHLLERAELLPLLRDTGCAFVTSAVESVDDRVLAILEKGHTRTDFIAVVERFRDVGLALQPTFVPFTPWLTLAGYEDLLATLARLDLIDNVPSIQLAIRLLIPAGSRLLELDEVRDLVGPFDADALTYGWRHPDPRVDELQRSVEDLVEDAGEDADRRDLFLRIWDRLQEACDHAASLPPIPPGRPRATIPYLTEPWYC